jgi:hypothetical protein
MLSRLVSFAGQPEWRSLRYQRLLRMQDCPHLQGLVRDTAAPSWAARLYAGVHASTTLAIPATIAFVLRGEWAGPLQSASIISVVIVLACLAWPRAARECNRAGLWTALIGLTDLFRLRRLILDAPYAVLLVRYRKHFVSLRDVRGTFMRIAGIAAKRQGVFLDHAMFTTKQAEFFAGDLANRLVAYSDELPAEERNLQQDLLAVARETEWLNADVASAILTPDFRSPI